MTLRDAIGAWREWARLYRESPTGFNHERRTHYRRLVTRLMEAV